MPIGVRAIIDVAVHTCATSCGYSLPVFHFQRKRTILDDFHSRYDRPGGMEALQKYKGAASPSVDAEGIVVEKGHDGGPHVRRLGSALELYWAICNTLSIDGLPGMRSVAPLTNKEEQQRLLTRAKEHDAWQAPPDDLGPIRSPPMTSSQTGKRAAPGGKREPGPAGEHVARLDRLRCRLRLDRHLACHSHVDSRNVTRLDVVATRCNAMTFRAGPALGLFIQVDLEVQSSRKHHKANPG